MMNDSIPLKVLICDPICSTAQALQDALLRDSAVPVVKLASTVEEAQVYLRGSDLNTIFIDVTGLGIDVASNFIFSLRTALPEIVFVLYVDLSRVESNRKHFYAGERRRFNHYYALDKNTPISEFSSEVQAVVRRCQSDLSWRLSEYSLAKLSEEAREFDQQSDNEAGAALATQVERIVSKMLNNRSPNIVTRSVFLSYRFEEEDLIDGLIQLLIDNNFTVLDGKSSNTYIGQGIIDRIRQAEFFLCLMTKHKAKEDGLYTTSPWLLEEKGAALALGKRIVLMVEDGVDEIGGLQGDWQRIHFNSRSFLKASLAAVIQLKSYTGG
jgi:hypothetical protein